nr:hypothetical protein [uncultured Dialister sp.]
MPSKPAWHAAHQPQPWVNEAMTKSPFLTVVTALPTSSTTPMAS